MEVLDMSMSEETYSISTASELTGVTKNRIRDWCLKGHLPEIKWISLGSRQHRRFTDRHIDFIKRVDRFRTEGFELPTAAKKAAHEISQQKRGENHG